MVLSFLGITTISASGDDTIPAPFSIQMSLLTPSQITLGEPILMRYKVVNASEQRVALRLGLYGTDWYTLTMRDSRGIAVRALPDLRPRHPQGAYSAPSGFMDAGKSSADYIPVTKRFALQRPGQYTLTIHVSLPYALDNTSAAGDGEEIAVASGLKQTQDITFPILVTNADPTRLRDTAEVLRQATDKEPNGALARAYLDALFSMPEAQAAASWRLLALKPSMSTDLVASELAELRTATGADILAQMMDIPNLECTPISDRLNRLYNNGDPTLRQHIKAIARKHGFEMPEVAGTPLEHKDVDVPRDGIAF